MKARILAQRFGGLRGSAVFRYYSNDRSPVTVAVAWLLLAALGAHGATLKRIFRIECEPPDATAQVTLLPGDGSSSRRLNWQSPAAGANGCQTEALKLYKNDQVVVVISRSNYESFATNLTFEAVRVAAATDKTPVVVSAKLAELQREVLVQFEAGEGARFFVNNQPSEANASLHFSRTNGAAPWSTVLVRAERTACKPVERTLAPGDLETAALVAGRRQVSFKLDEIEARVEVPITVNEADAQVFINDAAAGVLPGKISLMFHRPDCATLWSTNVVRIQKEGFEYRPPNSPRGTPAFQTNLTLDAAHNLSGGLELLCFQPVRSFDVPMRHFVVNRGEVSLETTNSVSAKDSKEGLVLTEFGRVKGEWLIAGRMGVAVSTNAGGKPGELVLSLPMRESRQGQPAEIVGASLWLVSASGSRKAITEQEPRTYDIDPCITRDGRTVFYSSNRRGQWGIWKKPASSGGALSPIGAGGGVDLEPAVFSPGEGTARIAFTRYFPKAAPGTPPRVVVQSEDGTTFAETQAGRSPAWSTDGTRIAYVSTDHKLWVMDATGENPRQLTTGPAVDASPIWLTDDKHIVYSAAANAEEAKDERGNFDLWMIDLEGNNPQQLTSNPSYDGFPVTSWDGEKRLVYFLSNRGGQAEREEIWRLYYFELR